MDPVSIIGLVSSVGAVTGCIVGTLKDLTDLRAKFGTADLNVRLLKSELTAIKSALDRIHDWAKYNLDADQTQAQNLGEGLEDTLDGCKLAMEVLAEDVGNLLGLDTSGNSQMPVRLGFRDKTKLIWHEAAVKDHQDRLGRQTAALNLLLTAIQCNTISEQTRLLRAPENRQKIQNVVDDASTIRAAMSQRASTVSASIRSGNTSAVSSRAFDAELLRTNAYQNAALHQRSKSDSRREPVIRRPDLNIQIQDNLSVDEGYDTMSRTTSDSTPSASHLSPLWSRGSLSRPVRPFETNPMRASDPGNVYKIRTSPDTSGRPDPSSRQPYSPVQSPVVKTVDRKKSFWGSLRRKSDSIVEDRYKQQEIQASTPVSRLGRKGFENRFHTSIDLSARDGKNCPPIVRAAQTGSVEELGALLDAGASIEDRHRPTGRNAMAVAAHCGHEEVVELLLRHGASVSGIDYLLCTPLHLAASRGHVGIVQLLIRENASLEDRGPDEKSSLRLSCDNGYLEAAELLLAHGAKVNARDKNNLTSLHAAAKRGDFDTIALLTKYGAHVEAKDANFMDALHYACEGGHNTVIDLLLSKKADIETPGNERKTPLITAASAGHAHTVDFLLKRRASLKSKGSGDMTALHWAAFNGHVEVVDLLVQKKAQINAVNIDGRSPLHLAVMGEHFPVVELLLRKNSLLEGQCRNNFRPLHYACDFDSTDIALLLLRSGAEVDASTNTQHRPLHIAVTSGKMSMVTMLLDHGANINTRNASGDRALLLACSHGHAEIVKTLLDRGAPLRSKFTFGPSHEDSPLCVAAKNGHSDIVDLLISRGSSVREKDEHAWQPLRYGAHYGHPEVVERLLAAGASLSGMQSWGFNQTAATIGFAQNVNIPEDRKEHVMVLLQNTEDMERQNQESETTQKRPSGTRPNLPELDPGIQPTHTELRSSTTRAGAGGLGRRFSFESRAQSTHSDGEQTPSQPYSGVSPLPAGEFGLTDPQSPSDSQTISPMPYIPYYTSIQLGQHRNPSVRITGANTTSTTPARTASERLSSRYQDVARRWQATIAEVPSRSATVSSTTVPNFRRPDPSQQTFPPAPRPVPPPVPFPAISPPTSNDSAFSSMPFSPDSITRSNGSQRSLNPTVLSPPPPPPAGWWSSYGPYPPPASRNLDFIDLTDPSWMPILDELMQMGITEDQITGNTDFILDYVRQKYTQQEWQPVAGGVSLQALVENLNTSGARMPTSTVPPTVPPLLFSSVSTNPFRSAGGSLAENRVRVDDDPFQRGRSGLFEME